MNFRVIWLPSAEQALARLWMDADDDRAAISAAANQLDTALAQEPFECGESRSEGTRILIEAPLAIRYSVEEQQSTVTVWAVWLWARR